MAYGFNGSTQCLSTASTPVTAPPLTIAAWIRPDASYSYGAFVSVAGQTPTNARPRCCISGFSSGGLNYFYANTRGSATQTSGGGEVSASINTWTHVAGIFTTTSRSVYVNAVQDTPQTTTLTYANAFSNIYVGVDNPNQAVEGYGYGLVADVGVWSVVLTAAEIASLADGVACSKIRPQSLQFYAPLVRDLVDVRGGLAITNTNSATVANHPRIFL